MTLTLATGAIRKRKAAQEGWLTLIKLKWKLYDRNRHYILRIRLNWKPVSTYNEDRKIETSQYRENSSGVRREIRLKLQVA